MQINIDVIIPELSGSKIRRTADGRFSVYDIIRIAGGKKNPRDSWKSICQQYSECVERTDAVELGSGRCKKLTPVATPEDCLYIISLLPGQFGKAYRDKAAKLVYKYILDSASAETGSVPNDRTERAKKRLLSCESNKQIAQMAATFGINLGLFHNSRYQGLYESTAKELREQGGLNDWETPLDSLSALDNTMNSLANQLAAKFNSPDMLFDFAEDIRNSYKLRTGQDLQPTFENTRLRPAQARKIMALKSNKQDSIGAS